ncbi:MAG: UDP-glucose/GDP-mannose dehydrogenase family protein [Candidatus Delongbacteria bacterium]|nr:UDP-glucose/GDP-mannose dehydrogenase family protein [Candidatus Delongbacteria bacterium]
MNITMVGTGYVGLVSGTCFAETGVNVTCVDVDKNKVEMLNNNIMPIYEPGLSEMVERNVKKGRLHFSTDLGASIHDSEVVMIAVGTPPGEDGSADLKYVLAAAKEIGLKMNHYMIVVNKSTVPVGTGDKVRKFIQEELDKRNVNLYFDVVSNPEFLREGQAINDFLKPDRIIVGVETETAAKVINRLYKPFMLSGHPVILMDIKSAEMTKYTANSMLATKISFMNDIANLCELLGADVNKVREGIGSDKRIGPYFIHSGTGYGGSCFPKDVKALAKTGSDNGYELKVLKAVEEVNDFQKSILIKKLVKYYGDLQDKTIAVWGLAFKPHTDDMREAPSLVIIENLLKLGAKVKAYDQVAFKEAKKIFLDKIEYSKDQYSALEEAEALLIVTEWPEFKDPNFTRMKELMKKPVIFDGRNIFDTKELKELGFEYYCIGVKTI